MTEVHRRLQEVRGRIADACAKARREPESVRLVAVSKTVPAAVVAEAMSAGQIVFGEKPRPGGAPEDGRQPDPARHGTSIGHLQKNKARLAAGVFELIHGIDDPELAGELDRRAASRRRPSRCSCRRTSRASRPRAARARKG